MKTSRDQAFKFFVPLNLSKAKNDQGKEVMKIGGIASTPDEDSDGEFLDPHGFDLDYFLKYGFLNWHHQSKTNPAAIVGEPTKAEVKNKKLYIEGELYADSPLAKDIYQLAKSLESSNSGRRLGFSIEGKVTERDPMNAKIVKKAQITGCAITPTPKNSHTLAEIIKGQVDDMNEEYDFDVQEDENGGETQYILDIVKPSGERITVDKNLNIAIKSMNTTNAAPLKRESVDGSVKDLQKVGQKINKRLTKGEVYGQIFAYLPDDNLDGVKDVYAIVETIEKSLNSNIMDKKISQEAIDKAFKTLGIVKGYDESQDEFISKAEDEEGETDDVDDYEEAGEAKDAETKEAAEKGMKSKKPMMDESEEEAEKGEDEDMSDEEYEAMKKSYKAMCEKTDAMKKAMEKYEVKKGMNTEGDTMGVDAETEGGTESPKDNKASKVAKGQQDELEKGLGQDEDPLALLIKAEMGKVSKEIEALGTIQKAMSDNFEDLESRISAMESSSQGRKSVVRASVIEKSFDANGGDGTTTLSATLNKAEILDILESKADITEKGVGNMAFANAMGVFESSGYLDPKIAQRLFVDNKIRIVR